MSTTPRDGDVVCGWGEITIPRSPDEAAALRAAGGGPIIVHGSATRNRARSGAGLIDRCRRPVESESCRNGIQKLVYEACSASSPVRPPGLPAGTGEYGR